LVAAMSVSITTAQDTNQSAEAVDQETVIVNPKLPPYTFEIKPTGPGELTIQITGGPRRFKGQTITASVEDEKRPGFEAVDVNLDGYTDFALVANRGATGNINYEYWTFDPKHAVFKEADNFDDITYVDEKKRELISHSKGGNIETITEYYAVKQGKPIMTRSEQTTWAREVRDIVPSSYSDDIGVTITRLYKDGKLKRTFYQRMDE